MERAMNQHSFSNRTVDSQEGIRLRTGGAAITLVTGPATKTSGWWCSHGPANSYKWNEITPISKIVHHYKPLYKPVKRHNCGHSYRNWAICR